MKPKIVQKIYQKQTDIFLKGLILETGDPVAHNVQVFAKSGNLLIFQSGTNAHLKICC